MNFILQPWQLFFLVLAGWVNRQQQQVIEYLRTENQVLKEKLGKKRILLDDEQRRRLAVKAKVLGRKLLEEVGTLVTPDTLLRWHRLLVAQKWDHSDKRQSPSRPPTDEAIAKLIVKLAQENPTWGYDRIQGSLTNLGHEVSPNTIANVLKQHGLEPAPERRRQSTWKEFLRDHWEHLAATDFFTVEVWTKTGLITFYVLFVIELATRRVHLAGITTSPDEAWMKQTARELTNFEDGFLRDKKYLLMDRDGKFCEAFRSILEQSGVKSVRLPPHSPNLNAIAERFVRSVRSECVDRMIFFGETMLRRVLGSYLAHYHHERNHQGLDNRLLEPEPHVGEAADPIECRERLGGMLRYYYRRAT
ncbi:MAG: integrase core domain-containing protein [Planctomycetota bacterium]|nr:integrase core domain-containing protein [Planctomycetota bacterium]